MNPISILPEPRGIERIRAAWHRLQLRHLLAPALSPRRPMPSQRSWADLLAKGAALQGGAAAGVQKSAWAHGALKGEWWAAEAPAVRSGSVLYLHGGAYCMGSPRSHAQLCGHIARASGLPVCVLDYRLAPEHPHPAALQDALAAFDALSAQGPVAIAGDSTGGGLALATALALRDRGGAQPAALWLMSPWVDLAEPLAERAPPGEAMLSRAWTSACAAHFLAGHSALDPAVSPLRGDLRGLPPVLLQAGRDELLCPQAEALHAALTAAEVPGEAEIHEGRWHVFQLHAGQLGSATQAVLRAAVFLHQHWPAEAPAVQMHNVVILGAGMSGLCMGIKLQKAGLSDFVILEKSPGLGGTWWDTRYPGAQVDVPAPVYSFSFAPNPRWRQRFADADEIQVYMQGLAERHALPARMRLGRAIRQAHFDAEAGRWLLELDNGERLSARFFVCSTGPLSQPRWPEIEGLNDFSGRLLHTARWPADARPEVELRGKRIGVIGTGSTAAQLVPPLAANAAQLSQFQRTANWVLPRLERRYFALDQWLARVPPYAAAVRWFWMRVLEWGRRGFDEGTVARRGMQFAASELRRRQLPDERLREALTPPYPLGCKRIIYSNTYYPALSQPNAALVTTPIQRITARGLLTSDGREHEFDALVCATGFETVHLLASLEVRGSTGETLAEAWRDGPWAYHGITMPGFPNLFLMLGPNTATGHTSTLLFIEPSADHAIHCMKRVMNEGRKWIAVRDEVARARDASLQQRLAGSVWSQCRSWYRMDGGRIVAIWPGFTGEYVRAVKVPLREAYELG